MGIRIKMSPEELPQALVRRFLGIEQAIGDGMYHGAMYGQALLTHRTPKNTGHAASRWRVKRLGQPGKALGNGRTGKIKLAGEVYVELHNDAPYIAVLEYGARPHPVSAEGIEAIARWAQLKFQISEKKAHEMAEGIAWRLRHQGAKALYFVRDSRHEITAVTGSEIRKRIAALAGRVI